MKNYRIRNIIRKFHKGNFSEPCIQKFAWWMVSSEDDDQSKSDSIQELWEESVGSVNMDTIEDLEKLRAKIRNPIFTKLYKQVIAAGVLFIVILSLGYLYMPVSKSENADSEFAIVNSPYGDILNITLEDSTKVILNAGSSLVYPRHFSNNKRNVFLSGEASFDVAKDPKRPFTVETSCFNVTALGTKFEIDAYSDSNSASTTLVEGKTKIVIHHSYQIENQDYYLEPNQLFTINKNTGAVSISITDTEKKLSWTNGDLIFEGASFTKILSSLERKFGVSFVCDHIERMDGTYYVKFRSDESVEDILDIINQLSHHYNYQIDSDTIFIYPVK